MDLVRFIGKRLSPEDIALLRAELQSPAAADYDAIILRVGKKLGLEEELLGFARTRLRQRFGDLLELPPGRRLTVFKSSPPILLLVLLRHLIRESFGERFGDISRSLELARVGVEVAETVASTSYLGMRDVADLLGEAHCYLGNALRINSDLPGAEVALKRAKVLQGLGTRDRALKADRLSLLASLRANQGRYPEAARILDREVALRRLLGDKEKLGTALIERGRIACWVEQVPRACDLIQEGVSLVRDDRLCLFALHHLAEALAREGSGEDALNTLVAATVPLYLIDSEKLYTHHRWLRGITYRALGKLKEAESELRAARKALDESEGSYLSAIASLDLACVCVARGKLGEVRRLAEEALDIFRAEGLEERALTALIMLQEAARAEQVSERLAVRVTSFLARYQHDKALRFDFSQEPT